MKHRLVAPFLIASLAWAGMPAPLQAAEIIAGLKPDQRPAGAPVLGSYEKSGDWYRKALTGVAAPYPASLRFLEDQGAWFTPFIHPGMTGPYDIRGWHAQATAATSENTSP